MVPRDIAVSGCDNIEVTKDFSPPLSTVGIPVSDMGKEAVDKIHNMNNNTPQEETTYLRYITYIRESCGCEMSKKTTDVYEGRNNIIRELENRDEIISNTAYMSIDLTGVTTLEDLNNRLVSYIHLNSGSSSFYMCLYSDWDKYQSDEEYGVELSDRNATLEVGVKDGEWLQKVEFNAKDLIPSIYLDSEPQVFYFNMIQIGRASCRERV